MSRSSSRGGGLRTPLPDFFEKETLNNEYQPQMTSDEIRLLINKVKMLEENFNILLNQNEKLKGEKVRMESNADLNNSDFEDIPKLSKEQLKELEEALKNLKKPNFRKEDFKSCKSEQSKRKSFRDYFKSDEQLNTRSIILLNFVVLSIVIQS